MMLFGAQKEIRRFHMLPHCKNCCQQLVFAADAGEETFGPLPPITPTVLLQVFTAAIYSSRERVFEA